VEDLERRLRFSMVAYVRGGSPQVSCQQVADAIAGALDISFDRFSVHSFKPEDFLVVFALGEHMDRVAALPFLPVGDCSLFFRRWNRLAQAERVVAESRVHLAIEGIPPHAWDRSTVEHLLGTSCSLEEMAPESASRADLGLFKVTAWAREVDSIPPARMLWIPEPAIGVLAGGPQPVRRLRKLGMLEYRVLIHVSRVEEYVAMDGPARQVSPESVRSGEPSQGSFEGGFWTSRNEKWSLGREDRRGGNLQGGGGSPGGGGGRSHGGGGAGHGQSRVGLSGPSNWRLPRVSGPVHVQMKERLGGGTSQIMSGQNRHGDGTAFGAVGNPEASIAVHPREDVLAKGKEAVDPLGADGCQMVSSNAPALVPLADALEPVPVLVAPVGKDQGCFSPEGSMQASSGSVLLEATEDRLEVGQEISFGCVEMGSSICARADNSEEESFFDSLEAALDPETDAHEVGSSTREGYFTVSLSDESVLDGRHASTDPTLDAQPFNAVAVVPQAQSPAHDCGAVVLSASRGEVPLDKLRLFCSNVLLTLAPPLLKEVQSSQSLGPEADEGTPRRITRSGARQLVGKPP
jgi:uncharacterized membrane protein YgcG